MTTEQMIVFGFVAAAFLAGWLASFLIRRRPRPADSALPPQPPPGPPPQIEPVTAPARAATPPLVEAVGAALSSDAANDGMLSVVRENGAAALSELELDLADWGFTYGVAWAQARDRAPGRPDEALAQEALDAAQRVFRAYTGGDDWTQRSQNGSDAEPGGGGQRG